MALAASALFVVVTLLAFLPVTLSVFAYAFVEARHRPAWASLAGPAVALGGGPYRAAEMARPRLERAPLLVRAAALGCFYWSWFCMLAWVGVGIGESERPAMAPLVLAGLVVAVALARAGTRLLRRDPRAVGAGRRIAVGSVAHATGLVVLGFALGGSDWSAPAAVFGVVSLGVGALLGLALRHHGPLFALPTGPADAGTPLPGWLSRLLARRSRSRDASRPVVV